MAYKVIKLGLLLFIIVILYLFPGCSERMNTFEKNGMSITLTNDYQEKPKENITAYYESSKAAVIAEKDDFASINDSGMSSDISSAEYAELIIESSGLDTPVLEENGLTYFEYSIDTDFGSFKYLASIYKSSDAFWLIQFSCQTDIYDSMRSEFFAFAHSVKV